MSKTEKPISKNLPEIIANENPIRVDWTEASKNHPFLSSITISCGSYMVGKKILNGIAAIANAGTGTYKETNKPADFTTDVLDGTKQSLPVYCMVFVQSVHYISCLKTNNETY